MQRKVAARAWHCAAKGARPHLVSCRKPGLSHHGFFRWTSEVPSFAGAVAAGDFNAGAAAASPPRPFRPAAGSGFGSGVFGLRSIRHMALWASPTVDSRIRTRLL